MLEIIGIVLYIAFLLLCVGIFLFILWVSLVVGGASGIFIGIFKGFKNYILALVDNLKLRR